MVEALKHIPNSIDFKDLKVQAKENIRYKRVVETEAQKELKHFKKYTKDTWFFLTKLHLKKVNFVINDNYSLPTESIIQSEIFLKQLEKYINIDATVAVLSAFPVFLFDYYGYEYISTLLELFIQIHLHFLNINN